MDILHSLGSYILSALLPLILLANTFFTVTGPELIRSVITEIQKEQTQFASRIPAISFGASTTTSMANDTQQRLITPLPELGAASSSDPAVLLASTTDTSSNNVANPPVNTTLDAPTQTKHAPTTNQPQQPTTQTPATVATETPDQLNTETRAALVNILCTTRAGGSFNPISGSGSIISRGGIIITNAHVAQYLLLRDYPAAGNTDCVVRMGSPAQPVYRASLLYLPPVWIDQNASKINTEGATSTGQNDYAFLLITSTTNGSPLPTSFPYLPITLNTPAAEAQAYVGAYPAQYLGGIAIQKSLYASSAYATVKTVFGFDDQNPNTDLFSLTGSVVSQEGSSGGVVARPNDGALEGIITTENDGATTADRMLYALTLAYIDRSLAANGQGGIINLASGDVVQKVLYFNSTVAPELTQKLIDVLGN